MTTFCAHDNVLCSWQRSVLMTTFCVHDDVQHSMFIMTFSVIFSWRRSTFYVYHDVQRYIFITMFNILCHHDVQCYIFMTTFSVLCSWWRGRKHRPPRPQPPPKQFVLLANEPKTTVHWFQNRKELLEASNGVTITRMWPGVLCAWVWVWTGYICWGCLLD